MRYVVTIKDKVALRTVRNLPADALGARAAYESLCCSACAIGRGACCKVEETEGA